MSVQTERVGPRIPRWVFATVIALDVLVLIALIVLLAIASDLITLPSAPPPAPVPGTIQYLRAQEDATLYHYGWVDEKAGVAHIPIQRAIDLTVERGLPARPATAQTAKDQGTTLPSYSSSGTQTDQVLH